MSSSPSLIEATTYLDRGVAPRDHIVHLYDREDVFLDTLEGFVHGGFRGGEAVLVIATPVHLFSLEQRLVASGCDVDELRAAGDYVALDAATLLARFTLDGMPDEQRFVAVMDEVIAAARASGRHARAFGEMVALMWADGNRDGARRLEQLWNSVCQERSLSLLCAYPRAKDEPVEAYEDICALHSHVIAG